MVLAFGMHWLTTMPSDKLFSFRCPTRHGVLGGNLLVHPRIVIADLLGIQRGSSLLLKITWPISPSFLMKDGWTFFSQVDQLCGGELNVTMRLVLKLHS